MKSLKWALKSSAGFLKWVQHNILFFYIKNKRPYEHYATQN